MKVTRYVIESKGLGTLRLGGWFHGPAVTRPKEISYGSRATAEDMARHLQVLFPKMSISVKERQL